MILDIAIGYFATFKIYLIQLEMTIVWVLGKISGKSEN